MKPRHLAIIGIFTLIWATSSVVKVKSAIGNEPANDGASVRALGMGSAFTLGPAASDSSYWNPSSIGFLNGMQFSLVGLSFAEHSTHQKGAFSVGLNPQQLGISRRPVGNISLASWFDGWGEDLERNRILLFGYGYSFGRAVAAGANIRYHRRNENIYTHLGWSYDLGIQFSRKLTGLGDRIAFGLSVEDLGGRLRRNGQLIQNLPAVVRFGTTFYLGGDAIFSGDLTLHNDDQIYWKDRFRAHLGAEKWLFSRQFGMRLGYTAITNYDRFTDGEWSRGFSLRNNTAQLDYAYVSGGKFGEGSHWIAATLRWNGRLNSSSMSSSQQPAPILMPNPPPSPPNTAKPISQLNGTATEFRVSEGAISPNDDGVKDNTKFNFKIPAGMTWRLEICDESGELVQYNSGHGLSAESPTWNGRNDEGNLVNDGAYTAQFMAFDSHRNPYFHREAVIHVDTIPANLKLHAEPLLLVPPSEKNSRASLNGLLATNVPTVHVQISDSDHISRWELEILESGGNVIDRLEGNDAPPNTIVWNKWSDYQWFVGPDTDYHCAMTVYDTAGNRTTRNAPLPLIDLLPTEVAVVEEPLRQKEPFAEHVPLNEPDISEPESKECPVVLTLPGVVFGIGKFEVDSECQLALGQVADAILAQPEARVTIEGHTDSKGNADYNLELSYERAEAVKNYLVGKFGISPEQLETIGHGEERPIADNDVETNRQKNRRVEVLIFSVENPQDTDRIPETVEFEVPSSKVMSPSYIMNPVPFELKVTPKWTLLLSSFKHRENAELFVENLEMLDITDDIQLSEVIIRSKKWYRVTGGHFDEQDDAVELVHRLRKSQGIESFLISAH